MPKILTIVFGRFDNAGVKNHKNIPFEKFIEVKKFSRNNEQGCYRFVGAVLHNGNTLKSGHYTTVAQISGGKYYYFNDRDVNEIYWTDLKKFEKESYILFYEKLNDSTAVATAHTGLKVALSSTKLSTKSA